jgi:hypothetical protein
LWIEEDSAQQAIKAAEAGAILSWTSLFPPQQQAGMVPAREPYKDVCSITYKNNEMVFKTYV